MMDDGAYLVDDKPVCSFQEVCYIFPTPEKSLTDHSVNFMGLLLLLTC